MSLKNSTDVYIPGPGDYYTFLSVADKCKNKTIGKNGVFGSTEKRFVHTE